MPRTAVDSKIRGSTERETRETTIHARPQALAFADMRVGLILLVIVGLLLCWRFGVFARFGDPAALRQSLLGLGGWGYVAFVGAYTVLQPFGVPGSVFVFSAPLIWPWPVAFGLSMVGTMGASVVGFSFTRFVARDWIAPKIPARFRKYDEALEKRAFATVFWLRLVLWMPQLLHAFFGVSRVSFATHFWGSLAGYVLPLFTVSYFGSRIWDVLKTVPIALWIVIGILIVLAMSFRWIHRRNPPT